ncbi:MAG: hypothetical protein JXR94_19625 [Candidatus Hydrogenedentes bacterium]|nr:hypothetical protein [Candidatus Hydrogenedentota bacterium]
MIRGILALAVTMGTPGSQAAATSEEPAWVCVSEKAAFSPRDTAEDLVFAGKMWLSNGYYHGNILSRDLWASTDGATWTLVRDDTPYDGYSEMVVYGGRMWAIKGSVWASTDGATWAQVAEHTPFGARGYGEVVVHDGKMWHVGAGADVWYSTDGASWTCATAHAPYGDRGAAAVAVYAGRIWLMGGWAGRANTPPEKGYAKSTSYNDVWCSADGAHWERVIEHAPWTPRVWFISKAYAGRLWIVGGYDNVNAANLGGVWYTQDGTAWHKYAPSPGFSARHEPTCYVYDSSLWVVAGNSWPVVNDVWRLTLPEAADE